MAAPVELLTGRLTTEQELAIRHAAATLPDTWQVNVAVSVLKGPMGFDVRVNGPGFVTLRSFDASDSPDRLSVFVTDTASDMRHHPTR